MYICMHVCMYVCTYVCMYVCMYIRMYVCTYVCMYVRMYVCMYIISKCKEYVRIHMYVDMVCANVMAVMKAIKDLVHLFICSHTVCMYVYAYIHTVLTVESYTESVTHLLEIIHLIKYSQ